MENLNIEKFNPTRAELLGLVEKYKTLEIRNVDDAEGYIAVDNARKTLKKTRVQIEKDGKLLRSEAIAFQKAVIEKEKELVGMIEPLEIELTTKQKTIDEAKMKIERRALLPEKLMKLQEIGLTPSDDFILEMGELEFSEYFNQAKSDYLIEKERKQQEEREEADLKFKQEQEAAQQKLRDEQEAAQQKIKEELAAIEAAKAKIEEERLTIEKEKQQIIDDAKAAKEAKEKAERDAAEKLIRDKEEAELRAKREAEEKVAAEAAKVEAERAEKEALEKETAYQAFLTAHGYTKEDDDKFLIQRNGNSVTLYRKLGEFNL